jgi:hypothetical protein
LLGASQAGLEMRTNKRARQRRTGYFVNRFHKSCHPFIHTFISV